MVWVAKMQSVSSLSDWFVWFHVWSDSIRTLSSLTRFAFSLCFASQCALIEDGNLFGRYACLFCISTNDECNSVNSFEWLIRDSIFYYRWFSVFYKNKNSILFIFRILFWLVTDLSQVCRFHCFFQANPSSAVSENRRSQASVVRGWMEWVRILLGRVWLIFSVFVWQVWIFQRWLIWYVWCLIIFSPKIIFGIYQNKRIVWIFISDDYFRLFFWFLGFFIGIILRTLSAPDCFTACCLWNDHTFAPE